MIAGYSIGSCMIICIGVFVAALVDAIGGGGGLISLPAYLLAGLPVHYAIGTNKLSSFLGTTASTARYIRRGYVNWKLAVPSILLAIIGSHLGTRLQLRLSDRFFHYLMIVLLPVIAFVILKKKGFKEAAGEIDPLKQKIIVWAASFVIGMYDGFYGPGTGTFLLIVFCRLAKMDLKTASGNVKIVNLSSNVGALLTSLSAGKVIVPIGILAGAFGFLGHYIGAGLMIRNGSKVVTPVIVIVLSLLMVKLITEALGIPLF